MKYVESQQFGGTYTGEEVGTAVDILHMTGYSAHFVYDNKTAAAGTDVFTGKTEVQTLTFANGATTVSGDYFALTDTAGNKWAVALQKKGVETVTFPAKAATTAGDNIIIFDTTGAAWGIGLDVTGSDPEPTYAAWTSIPAGKKVMVDISGATDAPSVAAAVEVAVDALTGFTALIVTDDGAANGTMTFSQANIGYVEGFLPSNAIGDGAGSITRTVTVLSANAPSGAVWTAIPAARKAQATITAAQTNAQVAAAVETVLDGLTDIPFTTTVSTNTIICTNTVRGNTAAGIVKNRTDATGGTITVANTTQGIDAAVNVTANTITMASHGYTTGSKGQLTISGGGTLPDGLSTSTDYFVIVVDANTIKLASSLVNAVAGTAIDIIDQGTADKTMTFTATALANAAVKMQWSNNGTNWDDVASGSANVTADGNKLFNFSGVNYRYIRPHFTLTAGQVEVSCHIIAKGD